MLVTWGVISRTGFLFKSGMAARTGQKYKSQLRGHLKESKSRRDLSKHLAEPKAPFRLNFSKCLIVLLLRADVTKISSVRGVLCLVATFVSIGVPQRRTDCEHFNVITWGDIF